MSYKLLLLDDDERFRKIVLSGLLAKGLEVFEAGSGEEAKALLRSHSFDLLIIDGVLPDTEGIRWIDEYRSQGGTCPIIFVSSQWQPVEIYHLLTRELAVSQIIHKPVIASVFAEQVYSEITRSHWASASNPMTAKAVDQTLTEFAQEYLDELPAEIMQMFTNIEQLKTNTSVEENLKALRLFSHKIKGTAGTFGFHELGDEMGRMEEAIKAHQIDNKVDKEFLREIESHLNSSRTLVQKYKSQSTPKFAKQDQELRSISRIVVADTDIAFLNAVEKVARQRLVETVRAGSAEEVLQAFKNKQVDALLIDAKMAEDESYNLIKSIRELTREETPIAFVSSGSDLDEQLLAPHLGASLFLTKPIDPDTLEDAIQRLMILKSQEHPKILIVDDDYHFARKVSNVLHEHGMDTQTLTEPSHILDKLQEFNPDILLLDLMMPYISGFDICKMLRTIPRWQDLPILFVTAQTGLETRVAAFACGADDYLPKPLADEELIARVTLRIERSRLLKERSERDPVTGLLIRRSFMERFNAAMSTAKRINQPVSLILFDLDNFKSINDRYGHLAGDAVLAGLGRLMAKRFRVEDLRGRWGGDEFVLALVGSGREQSVRLMQNFLNEFSTLKFTGENGSVFTATLSAGVSTFPADTDNTYELMRAADLRLYEAKTQGRNRVIGNSKLPSIQETKQ